MGVLIKICDCKLKKSTDEADRDVIIPFSIDGRDFEAINLPYHRDDDKKPIDGNEILQRVPDMIGQVDYKFLYRRVNQRVFWHALPDVLKRKRLLANPCLFPEKREFFSFVWFETFLPNGDWRILHYSYDEYYELDEDFLILRCVS